MKKDVHPAVKDTQHVSSAAVLTFLGGGPGQFVLQLLSEAVVGLDGVLQSLPQAADLPQVFLHQV